MSSILFYITGHGFGHAVRCAQIIRSLKRARPDLSIHVRSTVPQWLVQSPSCPVLYSRQVIDVGMLQPDSLELDIGATLKAWNVLRASIPRLIDQELRYIKDQRIRLIVADIPPLAFEIGARASVASVGITNFVWSWIYRAYVAERAGFQSLVEEMEQCYGKATLALALPYACDLGVFPVAEPIPWIGRVSNLSRGEARRQFGLPERASVVLLSFGGLGLRRLNWNRLQTFDDYFFVATGESPRRERNLLVLSHAQSRYEDLVRAASAIVTKPGYGIVADAIAHRVPVLYSDRGNFPEYGRLVEALEECATAEFIARDDLLAGNLRPYLDRLLTRKASWRSVALNGAEVAGQKALALLG